MKIKGLCLLVSGGAVAVVHESKVLYESLASDHRSIAKDMTICE